MNLSLSGLMAHDGRAGCAGSQPFASGARPTVSSVLTNKLPIRLRVRACDLRIRPIIRPDKSQIAFIIKPEGRGNLTSLLFEIRLMPTTASSLELITQTAAQGTGNVQGHAGSTAWPRTTGPLRRGLFSRWRLFAFTLLAFNALALSGCQSDQAVVWQTDVASPDGHYTVHAETIQQSGPGNAWISTTVELIQTGQEKGVEILNISHSMLPRPASNAVRATWIGERKLRLEWHPGSELEFQAIRSSGVDIEAFPLR